MKISDIVEEYIALRTELDSARKTFKLVEKTNKASMDALEVKLLEISNETGVDSFKTEVGTAFKTVKKYATMKDKDALVKFSIDNSDFGLMTSHVNKSHVIELIEQGVSPESFGVEYTEEQSINIRRA